MIFAPFLDNHFQGSGNKHFTEILVGWLFDRLRRYVALQQYVAACARAHACVRAFCTSRTGVAEKRVAKQSTRRG